MSKLADRIRKTMRTEPAPIGFRAVRPAKTPQMLVAVLLDRADDAGIMRAVENGAGVVVVKGVKPQDAAAAVKAAGEAACGIWPNDISPDSGTVLKEASADFLVFDAEATPAAALLEDKLGYVLTLNDAADDTYLRVLESVALDAVLLADWKGPLTLKAQVDLRRIAGLARKPLMLPVSMPIASADLECLRDAGVSVLLVDGSEKKALDGLPSLVKLIEDLPGPRRRREPSLEVLLPRAAEMAGEEEEEEEEGE